MAYRRSLRAFPPFGIAAFAATLMLAACATFPELESAETPESARADYPRLVPLGPVLAGVESGTRIDAAAPQGLAARAAALRARATALRAPLDASDRARLGAARARNAERLAGG